MQLNVEREDLLSKKLEIDDQFVDNLQSVLLDILETEHSSQYKHEIKNHSDRIQYACPYCGDSNKNPWKKRGNLYLDSLQLHCFNAGCPSPHVDLPTFLTDFGYSKTDIRNIFGSYGLIKKFVNENKDNTTHKFQRTITDNSVRGDEFLELEKHGILIEDFKKMFRASSIEKGMNAYKYLKKRLQHKNLDKVLTSKKGLILLNLNAKGDRVIGCQIKTFNDAAPYLTYDIERLYQEKLGSEIKVNDVIKHRMNLLSTYFNVMSSRLTGKLTIFEGPFDSFLMRNAVATCSAGKNVTMFKNLPNIRFLYDNDEGGNKYAIKRLREGFPVFLWNKFLKDHKIDIPIKDYNELMIYCVKNKSKAYQNVDNYFSKHKHDIFYIN